LSDVSTTEQFEIFRYAVERKLILSIRLTDAPGNLDAARIRSVQATKYRAAPEDVVISSR
jgi:hypothetical protein